MNFPKSFRMLLKTPGVKAAFVSEFGPSLPSDCQNCGGVGTLAVFLATKGPFHSPAAPYNGDEKTHETSHFDPNSGPNGGWWVGRTVSETCPDCNGSGSRYTVAESKPFTSRQKFVESQVSSAVEMLRANRLVHPQTGEVLE